MRRYTLLTLLSLLAFQGYAQKEGTARVFVYSDIGAGGGSPNIFKPTANVLFLKRHELSFGYAYYERRGRDIPEDYDKRGLPSNRIIYPQESFSAATVTYGYVLYPKKRPYIVRYVLRAGVAVGHRASPYNYTLVNGAGLDRTGTIILGSATLLRSPSIRCCNTRVRGRLA